MSLAKYFFTVAAGTFLVLSLALAAIANDLALYTGPTNPGWISDLACRREADEIIAGIEGMFDSTSDFGDGEESGLGEWVKAHTANGQADVIILACGTTPNSLYPFPNLEPDGSVVEEFIDNGNVLINIADWIFYMSYEGGVRSPDNGPSGAANIFDIPGLSFDSRSNNMVVNENGKKYLPSLKDFTTDRPWHLEQLDGSDWEVTTFAQSGDNDADPAVAVNKETGGIIAALIQKAWPLPDEADDNRGEVVIDFVKNWLTENVEGIIAVEPAGRLSITWGHIKISK